MVTSLTNHPSTFPEDWQAPVAGNVTFPFDPMHFPFPLSPLTASAQDPCFSSGFTQAAREYRSLVDHVDVMSRNLYRFWRLVMARPDDETQVPQSFQ